MRGQPVKWTRCPACRRIVVAIPVAGADPPTYRYGRHDEPLVEQQPYRLCPLSITTITGPVYDTGAQVPQP